MPAGRDFLNKCRLVKYTTLGISASSDGASASSDGVVFTGFDYLLALVSFGAGATSDSTFNFKVQVATDSEVPSDGTYAAFATDAVTTDMIVGTSDGLVSAAIYVDLAAAGKDKGCVKLVFGGTTAPAAPTGAWLILFRGTGPTSGESHSTVDAVGIF
jgi:hypothetical protein